MVSSEITWLMNGKFLLGIFMVMELATRLVFIDTSAFEKRIFNLVNIR